MYDFYNISISIIVDYAKHIKLYGVKGVEFEPLYLFILFSVPICSILNHFFNSGNILSYSS